MKRFEAAVRHRYGYLLVDLKAHTPEHERLNSDIFPHSKTLQDSNNHQQAVEDLIKDESKTNKRPYEEEEEEEEEEEDADDNDDDSDDDHNSLVSKSIPWPPGKRYKADLEEAKLCEEIWERRFKQPLRQEYQETIREKTNEYRSQGYSSNTSILYAANDELPHLRKLLRLKYAQFLMDYNTLHRDPIQQHILQSAKKLRVQHDMTVRESIQQAVKLRKDLFTEVWPSHIVDDDTQDSDQESVESSVEDASEDERT